MEIRLTTNTDAEILAWINFQKPDIKWEPGLPAPTWVLYKKHPGSTGQTVRYAVSAHEDFREAVRTMARDPKFCDRRPARVPDAQATEVLDWVQKTHWDYRFTKALAIPGWWGGAEDAYTEFGPAPTFEGCVKKGMELG